MTLLRAALASLPLLAPTVMAAAPPFDYDATVPLAPEEIGRESRDGARLIDLRFVADPTQPHQRTRAFLVEPLDLTPDEATASRPALLWGHWLGEPRTTNRTQYLDEALAWARDHGAVSLLTEAMWAAPDWYRQRVLEEDRAHGIRQVIAFRRAMDLLLAQPAVDPARTAFVAHDYSAMYGAIALAAEPRIRHAVFIAAAPTLEDWAFYSAQPADKDAYLAANGDLHLLQHWQRLAGRKVLLQFAKEDFYVPPARRDLLIESLAAEKTVRIYPGAGHEMTAPDGIRADRTAWLEAALLSASR